jgi:hypothetical protein
MQPLHRFPNFRFLYQERNRPVGCALTNDADVHVGNSGEDAARDLGLTANIFSNQRYQRFVILPLHFRYAL